MKNSFKALSRIQKFNIDEQRKILAGYIREEEEIETALLKQDEELRGEKAFSKDQNNNGDFGSYLKRYFIIKDDLEYKLSDVQKRIEDTKDILADMFKKKKTYDIVDEQRQKAQDKEDNLNEQKMLDEIGTNNYLNKNKK